MILPDTDKRAMKHFVPAVNNTASDELQAHTGMFAPHSNDGYYKLGLETAGVVREAVMLERGVVGTEMKLDPEVEKEDKAMVEQQEKEEVDVEKERKQSEEKQE